MRKLMKKEIDKSWKYALGIIKIDGLEPSDDFKELIVKECNNEITTDDIKKILDSKYKQKSMN